MNGIVEKRAKMSGKHRKMSGKVIVRIQCNTLRHIGFSPHRVNESERFGGKPLDQNGQIWPPNVSSMAPQESAMQLLRETSQNGCVQPDLRNAIASDGVSVAWCAELDERAR